MNNYIDVTEKWITESKPGNSKITFSNFVISFDNKRYDSDNSILNFETNEDILCANWFKNNIWYKCVFQPSVKYPQNVKSADLRIYGNCTFINGNTIEIKIIGSSREDGLIKRIKQAKHQSPNVLVDVSNYPYDEKTIKKNISRYFINHHWIKLIAVKRNDSLLFVWTKI